MNVNKVIVHNRVFTSCVKWTREKNVFVCAKVYIMKGTGNRWLKTLTHATVLSSSPDWLHVLPPVRPKAKLDDRETGCASATMSFICVTMSTSNKQKIQCRWALVHFKVGFDSSVVSSISADIKHYRAQMWLSLTSFLWFCIWSLYFLVISLLPSCLFVLSLSLSLLPDHVKMQEPIYSFLPSVPM